jgi:hypothetical protein
MSRDTVFTRDPSMLMALPTHKRHYERHRDEILSKRQKERHEKAMQEKIQVLTELLESCDDPTKRQTLQDTLDNRDLLLSMNKPTFNRFLTTLNASSQAHTPKVQRAIERLSIIKRSLADEAKIRAIDSLAADHATLSTLSQASFDRSVMDILLAE